MASAADLAGKCDITNGLKYCFLPGVDNLHLSYHQVKPLCDTIAVDRFGIMSCASPTEADAFYQPAGSEAKAKAQLAPSEKSHTGGRLAQTFTVVEQDGSKGFCVSGEVLKQAFRISFANVAGFLSAHSQECSKLTTVSNWLGYFTH